MALANGGGLNANPFEAQSKTSRFNIHIKNDWPNWIGNLLGLSRGLFEAEGRVPQRQLITNPIREPEGPTFVVCFFGYFLCTSKESNARPGEGQTKTSA